MHPSRLVPPSSYEGVFLTLLPGDGTSDTLAEHLAAPTEDNHFPWSSCVVMFWPMGHKYREMVNAKLYLLLLAGKTDCLELRLPSQIMR